MKNNISNFFLNQNLALSTERDAVFGRGIHKNWDLWGECALEFYHNKNKYHGSKLDSVWIRNSKYEKCIFLKIVNHCNPVCHIMFFYCFFLTLISLLWWENLLN